MRQIVQNITESAVEHIDTIRPTDSAESVYCTGVGAEYSNVCKCQLNKG